MKKRVFPGSFINSSAIRHDVNARDKPRIENAALKTCLFFGTERIFYPKYTEVEIHSCPLE